MPILLYITEQFFFINTTLQHITETLFYNCNILFISHAIPCIIGPQHLNRYLILCQKFPDKDWDQENDWYRLGLVLSRSNMANWVIRCSQDWLEPIYWRIHEKLLECELLHMDETRIQCNKEDGKLPSSDSFMWVMRSAASEKLHQGSFFYYSRSRSGDNAKKLLDGYKGSFSKPFHHNFFNVCKSFRSVPGSKSSGTYIFIP